MKHTASSDLLVGLTASLVILLRALPSLAAEIRGIVSDKDVRGTVNRYELAAPN